MIEANLAGVALIPPARTNGLNINISDLVAFFTEQTGHTQINNRQSFNYLVRPNLANIYNNLIIGRLY